MSSPPSPHTHPPTNPLKFSTPQTNPLNDPLPLPPSQPTSTTPQPTHVSPQKKTTPTLPTHRSRTSASPPSAPTPWTSSAPSAARAPTWRPRSSSTRDTTGERWVGDVGGYGLRVWPAIVISGLCVGLCVCAPVLHGARDFASFSTRGTTGGEGN